MKLLLSTLLGLLIFSSQGQIGYDIKPLKLDKYGQIQEYPSNFTPVKYEPGEVDQIHQYLFENEVRFDTSLTIINDTSGCHYKGEYLWFPQLKSHGKARYYPTLDWREDSTEYLSPWITNADYDQFRAYIRDSIMRRTLVQQDPDPLKWGFEMHEDDGAKIHPSDWGLNYDTKYEYMLPSEGAIAPNRSKYGKRDMLAEYFYGARERNGGPFKIDQRKLYYEFYWMDMVSANAYRRKIKGTKVNKTGQNGAIRGHTDLSKFIVAEWVSILRDTGFWYQTNLPENYKEWLTENYTTQEDYANMPVLGLTGYQAWAYCKWKEKVYVDLARRKGGTLLFPDIELSLPRKIQVDKHPVELPKIVVPEVNNAWWRITNEDYKAFVQAVQDSLVRDGMSDYVDPERCRIQTYDVYGEPQGIEDWVLNMDMSINEYYKNEDSGYQEEFEQKYLDKDKRFWKIHKTIAPQKLMYSYFWFDYPGANATSKYALMPGSETYEAYLYQLDSSDENGEPVGKDLNLSRINKLGNDAGVRSHEDITRFIVQEIINIYPVIPGSAKVEPYDFETCPDCTIKGIVWEQAKAYYSWYINKRPGHQKMTKKNPTAKMKPTKEQWEQIMSGKTVILPAKEIELPVPTFRYVIK